MTADPIYLHGVSANEVGRVNALWRYPVKSMAGESLDAVDVSWHGLEGDRRYAFVREGLERSGFPWLTIRERSDMWHYVPRFEGDRTLVRTPSGVEFDVIDPALAAELGHGARVIKQNRGVFDTMPLSLLSTGSVSDLREGLDPRRFRPNILVEGAGEDDWVGRVLAIGGMRMRVDQHDERCVVVNVDPDTAERDASILRKIAQERDSRFGVYGSVVEPGRIAVGDPVLLEDEA
jgi:uncharacterized protein YcbX